MTVLIVDYEAGNLASVSKAVSEIASAPIISQNPSDLVGATKIILPGVGAFCDAAERLAAKGWVEPLRKAAEAGVPFLGICVGMQLLADFGEEGGGCSGLGLISGTVKVLVPDSTIGERIPHMGWNSLNIQKSDPVFSGIESGADVYFAHSYYFCCKDGSDSIATTEYCGDTTAVVRKKNVIGAQFHPEISSRVGRQFLTNFLAGTP